MIFNVIWLLGFFLTCESGEFVQTLVGDELPLVSAERCLNAREGSLDYLSPPRQVAKLTNGRWSPMSDYETRFTPGSIVEFKEATMNDNGVYELRCSTINTMLNIQVEVLVPYELQASVGESVKLPCHFKTGAQAVDSVRWERGAELVLEQSFKSGKTHHGNRFRDRVEMSQDAHSRGDLSLHLESVQSQDQGQFYCKLNVTGIWIKYNGEPPVVRLWVSDKKNESCNSNAVSTTVFNLTWAVFTLLCCLISIIVVNKRNIHKKIPLRESSQADSVTHTENQ